MLADIEKLPTEPKKTDDPKERKVAENKFPVMTPSNPLSSGKPDNQSQRDQQTNKNPLSNKGPLLFGKPDEKKPITIKLEEPKAVVIKQNSPKTEELEKHQSFLMENTRKDLELATEKIKKLIELLESNEKER